MDTVRLKKALLVVAAVAGVAFLAWILFMIAVFIFVFGVGGGQFG